MWIVYVGVAVLVLVWVFSLYNGLVRLKNIAKAAWAQIDVQLKRRHDLIPNLVETAKGYMKHESETLIGVVEARAKATSVQVQVQEGDMSKVGELASAEGALTSSLGRLLASFEAYPDLKANQNYLALQEELTSTENRIGFARQFYNDSVMKFNNRTEVFPTNVVAGVFNFKTAEFFELKEEAAREAPKVSF